MSLPRTYRTYFDPYCTEYTWVSAEQKLLEIGRAVMHGFDLHQCVREILDGHSHVHEDDVHSAVCSHISEVCGGEIPGYQLLRRGNSIDTDIDLLIEYLMRRYRVAYKPDNGHYLADTSLAIDRQELDSINGWAVAARHVDCYNLYDYGNWVTYPDDDELLREYNLRAKGRDKGFVSYVCPEPWYGNPTTAKVIILGDAPRYDDFISRIANQTLKDPRLVEEVSVTLFDDYRGWWTLQGGCFYDTCPIGTLEPPVRPMDLYNSPTYRHWLDQFRRWVSWFGIEDEQTLFDNVAVINATAYPSVGDTPLAAGMLPSHYFLQHLVRYIATNNPDTIFVIPSEKLRSVWSKILACSYDYIAVAQRVFLLDGNHRKLNLSPRNLSQEQLITLSSRLRGM